MHWTTALSLCGSAFISSTAAVGVIGNLTASDVVPGAFIVEFADNHDTNSFVRGFSAARVAVRMKLDYKLFKGVSLNLADGTDIDAAADQLSKMASVKQIWPVRKIPRPDAKINPRGTSRNTAAPALNKRQTSNTFPPHLMTQVDRLHAKGIKGQGIKIGIVDTGVDYKHPALGGCFGPGCLVSYGRDLVGDDYNGNNSPQPDADPFDCDGHGTHVAGIIAAQDNEYGFTGVAPSATIGAYRVFGCVGGLTNDILIAAFYQAYEDGSDIITASIGGQSGWTEDPVSVAVQRIVEAGVPCTVAAGNDGGGGLLLGSSPANGKGVAAVASVDNIERRAFYLNATYTTNNSSTRSFGWVAGDPANWGNNSYPVWVNPKRGDVAYEDCAPLPEDTPDLSKYAVMIWTTGGGDDCFVDVKVRNAAAYGARTIMLYNDRPGVYSYGGFSTDLDAVGMVDPKVAATWRDLLSKNNSVVVNMVDPKFATTYLSSDVNTETGGFVSTFSSWGPTMEMDFKPQFAAPGGLILSTYPTSKGGYAILSGTSMATPHMAGIYALIGQVRGTFDPATIANVLAATANPNLFNDGRKAFPYLAPAAQQGAGLVQAYDAAYSTTIPSVSSISFNDTDHFTKAKFTIKNLGTNEVTYTLSNVGAVSAYTLREDLPDQPFPWNEFVTESASLSFSSDKITIPGGGEAEVTVDSTPPTLDASRLPVYSGYIALNSTNGESLSIPYLGMAGSLHNATIIHHFTGFRSTLSGSAVTENQTFTVQKSSVPDISFDMPYLALTFNLPGGTPLFRIDAVPLDSPGNTTDVLNFVAPQYWTSYGGFLALYWGYLADGSFAPAGRYKLRAKALRVFGDENKEEDYQIWETVPFVIEYAA